MREYLLVMLVAAAATYLLAAPVRQLALRWKVMAMVRTRDVHTTPKPYFGGLAMLGGFAVALALAVQMPFLSRFASVGHDAIAVLVAGSVLTLVGVLDDMFDLNALVKLGGQVLAAGIAVLGGVRIFWIPLPNAVVIIDDASSIIISVVFIAICVNAVNFVDGLDGLAAGVVAVGAGAFFAYSYVLAYEQDLVRATTASLLTVVTLGICLGFLAHNYQPARMFMGDAGSMLLGFLMAMSAISFTGQVDPSALSSNPDDVLPAMLPILLPFATLALPLADLILSTLRRVAAGRNPFEADKLHLHHRMMARGHSQAHTVLILCAWSAVIAGGLVSMVLLNHPGTWWTLAAFSLALLLCTLYPRRRRTTSDDG